MSEPKVTENPIAIGFEYAFPRDAQRLADGTMYEQEVGGVDTFTWLLGQALAGALATGTTAVIAAQLAADAATAALEQIAKHRGR